MGGAADFPQRSSSPLKRRASDLEQEKPQPKEVDVEMDAMPLSDSAGSPHIAGKVAEGIEQHELLETHEDVAQASDKPQYQMGAEAQESQDRGGDHAIPESERKLIAPK
jgi:hypothetical protein